LDCEVCGRPIFGQGLHVIIDGAKLLVCKQCSTLKVSTPRTKQKISLTSPRSPLSPQVTKRTVVLKRRPSQPTIPEGRELVEDYGHVIKKAREELELSQEELSHRIAEKVSVLQKLEAGRFVPSESLVQKLERILKIRLQQAPTEITVEKKNSKLEELTLGDIAILRKKRSRGEEPEERML
jgi:putative transcription factor